MVAKPDDRRVVVPARLRRVAPRTILARRRVSETGRARSLAIGRGAGRAAARRAVRGLRGVGEVDGCRG